MAVMAYRGTFVQHFSSLESRCSRDLWVNEWCNFIFTVFSFVRIDMTTWEIFKVIYRMTLPKVSIRFRFAETLLKWRCFHVRHFIKCQTHLQNRSLLTLLSFYFRCWLFLCWLFHFFVLCRVRKLTVFIRFT